METYRQQEGLCTICVSDDLSPRKIEFAFKTNFKNKITGFKFDEIHHAEEFYTIEYRNNIINLSFNVFTRKWNGCNQEKKFYTVETYVLQNCIRELSLYRKTAIFKLKLTKWYEKLIYVQCYLVNEFDNNGVDICTYVFGMVE